MECQKGRILKYVKCQWEKILYVTIITLIYSKLKRNAKNTKRKYLC